MTGYKFESELCELLKAEGFWALNIPKDKRGAQPFDVIAMKDKYVFVTDCKVCGKHLFPLERVEDNQWLAFETISKRTSANAGLTLYFRGDIYWVSYKEAKTMFDHGESSIELYGRHPVYRKEEVKEILGRYME